jgi:hypothetical protein
MLTLREFLSQDIDHAPVHFVTRMMNACNDYDRYENGERVHDPITTIDQLRELAHNRHRLQTLTNIGPKSQEHLKYLFDQFDKVDDPNEPGSDGKCRWCGSMHNGRCPLVKALDFYPDGRIRRVEFVEPPREAAP